MEGFVPVMTGIHMIPPDSRYYVEFSIKQILDIVPKYVIIRDNLE